jgi:hypothetical protein
VPALLEALSFQLRHKMETALAAFNASLRTNTKVKLVTTKKGKGRIGLTPLQEQPEPPNIVALTAALVQRWPMTNLLDILKETELRVGFTEAFRTVGAREMLKPEILQRRLLLCLYGLGTNAGLKRMCSGGGEDGYADLQYVRRRYIVESRSGAVATDAAPFPLPARQTGRADCPHPAFGQGSFMLSPTAGWQSELPDAGARASGRDAQRETICLPAPGPYAYCTTIDGADTACGYRPRGRLYLPDQD